MRKLIIACILLTLVDLVLWGFNLGYSLGAVQAVNRYRANCEPMGDASGQRWLECE